MWPHTNGTLIRIRTYNRYTLLRCLFLRNPYMYLCMCVEIVSFLNMVSISCFFHRFLFLWRLYLSVICYCYTCILSMHVKIRTYGSKYFSFRRFTVLKPFLFLGSSWRSVSVFTYSIITMYNILQGFPKKFFSRKYVIF